jgi:hypothetical protein
MCQNRKMEKCIKNSIGYRKHLSWLISNLWKEVDNFMVTVS